MEVREVLRGLRIGEILLLGCARVFGVWVFAAALANT